MSKKNQIHCLYYYRDAYFNLFYHKRIKLNIHIKPVDMLEQQLWSMGRDIRLELAKAIKE